MIKYICTIINAQRLKVEIGLEVEDEHELEVLSEEMEGRGGIEFISAREFNEVAE